MPTLNRDALLAITALRTVTVDLPALGSSMILRELTGRDLMSLQERTGKTFEQLRGGIDFTSAFDLMAWMLRLSWVDDDGDYVMADDDVERVINMPLSAMMALITAVIDPMMQLNGLTPTSGEDAKKN